MRNLLWTIKDHFHLSRHDFSSLHMKYEWEGLENEWAIRLWCFWQSKVGASFCLNKWIPWAHPSTNALYSSVWLGVINIPAVALGMFSGGVVMKKYKLDIMGAAKFTFGTSLLGYFLSLFFLAMGCDNSKVAGITVSYGGYVTCRYFCWFHDPSLQPKNSLPFLLCYVSFLCLVIFHKKWWRWRPSLPDCLVHVIYFSREQSIMYAFSSCFITCRVGSSSHQEPSLFSDCNTDCLCSGREWDPVCGENGLTYVSPCLAGCTSSSGSGRNMVRHTPLSSVHIRRS